MTIKQDLGRGLIQLEVPTGFKICTTGDSLEANGIGVSSNNAYMDQRGWMSWLQALTGHRFVHNVRRNDAGNATLGHNRATGGWETAEMLDNLGADIIANNPKVVSILGGTNDITASRTFQQITSNLKEMIDLSLGHNAEVWIWTIFPRSNKNERIHGETTKAFTAAQEILRLQVNNWIRDIATSTPNVRLLDMEEDFQQAGFAMGDTYSHDGLHINSRGALLRARKVLRMLNDAGYVAPPIGGAEYSVNNRIFPRFPADYDSSDNPHGNQLTNFDLSATGGTAGTLTTGTVPSNFTLENQTGSTAQMVSELIEEPGVDGRVIPKWKITIKNDGSGSDNTVTLRTYAASPTSIVTNAVSGNWTECGIIAEVGKSANGNNLIRSIYVQPTEVSGATVRFFNAGYTYTDGSATEHDYLPQEDMALALRTPPLKLTGTTGIQWKVQFDVDETVNDEVVIKLSAPYYQELAYTPQDVTG